MAGYPIGSLKKAEVLNGLDAVPVTQDGITKQVEKSVMDQAVIITQSGAQSSGIIRREGTFVLNSATLINFTLENATGRKTTNNVTADDAASAAGWKIYVFNTSTISHTVIHGANSWSIASGETLCFYWTGSKFTLHTEVIQDLTVKGNTKLPNVSAVQSITGSDDLAVIASGGLLKKTTPNDIKTALNLVNTTQLNGALVDYAKSITSNVLNTKVAHYSIEFEHKNYCSTSLLFAMRGGNSVIVNIGIGDGNAVQTPQAIYSQKIDNQTMSVNFKTNGSYKADLYISSSVYAQYLNVSNLIPSSAKVTFVEALDSLPEGTSAITVKEGVTQTDLNGALADYQKLSISQANANNIGNTVGKYYFPASSSNIPVAGYIFGVETEISKLDTNLLRAKQIAKKLAGNTALNDIYVRTGNSTDNGTNWTFGDWEKITTSQEVAITLNIGTFTGKCFKSNETLNIIGILKVTSAITGYSTNVGTINCDIGGTFDIPIKKDGANTWYSLYVNSYKIIYSRDNIATGNYCISWSIPL